jgi:glycosyltransferase involved in cell wall biosynthesis
MARATAAVRYSVVVPVYGNAGSLPQVVDQLEWLQDRLDGRLEAVFVIDASPDDSAAVLRERLPRSPLASQLIFHSRNFGAFAAIRSGFAAARGDYVAAMAADLQEPIELIEQFFEKLSSGDWDVAVGTRTKRHDPGLSRLLSGIYWSFYRRVIDPSMPPGGVDIFATTRAAAEQLVSLGESHSSLVGQLFWLGYRRVEVPYERRAREHGTSAWSFRKRYRYLLDSIFSFSSLPISFILIVGTVGTVGSFVAALVVLITWAIGGIPVPGYTATMLVMLFATGAILSALGIVGTYVWRTFENTKRRPVSVIMASETFGG